MGATGRAAHNQRRRQNRQLRKEIVDEARKLGVDQAVIAHLEKEPPQVAKEWAQANGLPERFHPGNGHAGKGDAAPTPPSAAPQLPAPAPRPMAPGPRRGAAQPGLPPAPPIKAAGASWRQEPWCTPELITQVEQLESLQGQHRDESSLLNAWPKNITDAHGGTNTTRRVEFDNGMVGYFKPFDGLNDSIASGFGQDSAQQVVHEAAAWQLARQMGPPWSELVPPCVIRSIEGELGSVAVERPGRPLVTDVDKVPEWREAAFFDALIGQQDRHPANYLVAGDRLTLIDHGYSFARTGDYVNFSVIQQARMRENDNRLSALSLSEKAFLDRLDASPDQLGMDKILQPDRAAALRERVKFMRSTGVMAVTL